MDELERLLQKSRLVELYGDPPRTERLTWRERLLSKPWKPWVARKPSPWAKMFADLDREFGQ